MLRHWLRDIAAITLLFLSTSAFAEVISLASDVRDRLFASAPSGKMSYSIKDIPAAVMQACANIAYQHDFSMANPGEKFEATDNILDETLPERRLLWAGRLPNYYLLHYEHGGIGLHQHVVIVSYSDPKTAKVIWSGFSRPLKDYKEFLETLKAGKLSDAKVSNLQAIWHL
jgi:hypothetical protein